MSFNQQIAKSYASGVTAAFASPWASFKGSVVALNTLVSGSTASTAGLVITVGGSQYNIEWESLVANVQVVLATASITAQTVWQVSNDNTNWATLFPFSGGAYTTVAGAGAGTTTYYQSFFGINPGHPYIRMAVITGAATGGAGDNVTVSYNFRRRSFLA